jgi:hypothetical protein
VFSKTIPRQSRGLTIHAQHHEVAANLFLYASLCPEWSASQLRLPKAVGLTLRGPPRITGKNDRHAGFHVISRRVLTTLLFAACVLPVATLVVVAVGRLLGAMADAAGAAALDRIALALGILWTIDLVCLVLAQAINTLGPPDAGP